MKMYVKLTSLRKVRKIALSSGSYSSPDATAFVISMMRRRTLASFTAMKALTSSRPSEVAKKSVIALELRSTLGPPGSGPEGEKNSTGPEECGRSSEGGSRRSGSTGARNLHVDFHPRRGRPTAWRQPQGAGGLKARRDPPEAR